MAFKLNLIMRVHLIQKKESFIDNYERLGFLLHILRWFETGVYTRNTQNIKTFNSIFFEFYEELKVYSNFIDINKFKCFPYLEDYKNVKDFTDDLIILANDEHIKWRLNEKEFNTLMLSNTKFRFQNGLAEFKCNRHIDNYLFCISKNLDLAFVNSYFKQHYNCKTDFKIVRNTTPDDKIMYSVLLDNPYNIVVEIKEFTYDFVEVSIGNLTTEQLKFYRGDILAFIGEKLKTKDLFYEIDEIQQDRYLSHVIKYRRISQTITEKDIIRDWLMTKLNSGYSIAVNPA
jgi:hypothetical protein